MSNITQPPRGLISIFGLRDMGVVPNDLSPQIVGTFDISQLCLLNRELLVGTAVTSPGVGGILFPANAVVPAGELWYVWTYGIRTAAAAGESIRLTPCVAMQGAVIPIGDPRSAGAGEQLAANAQSGFWLGPGAGFGCVIEAETGAAKNINWFASLVRLRV